MTRSPHAYLTLAASIPNHAFPSNLPSPSVSSTFSFLGPGPLLHRPLDLALAVRRGLPTQLIFFPRHPSLPPQSSSTFLLRPHLACHSFAAGRLLSLYPSPSSPPSRSVVESQLGRKGDMFELLRGRDGSGRRTYHTCRTPTDLSDSHLDFAPLSSQRVSRINPSSSSCFPFDRFLSDPFPA